MSRRFHVLRYALQPNLQPKRDVVPSEPAICAGCDTPLPPEPGRSGPRRKWCSDRCRKRTSYGGRCERCGGETNGSNGPGTAATVCMNCLRWTREAVLLALEEWADTHGGVPPREVDWEGKVREGFPAPGTVVSLFGGWNAMLLEAGFALRCDKRPETHEAIMVALAAGEDPQSIADRYGVSRQAILQRLSYRGLSLADVRR